MGRTPPPADIGDGTAEDELQEDGISLGDGEALPVFAFFKPRPMITDLTKGGMGEVTRRMCAAAPPKPVGQLDRCTTGLMIFTLDGRLTCHLNSHAAKTYRAWYEGWTSSNGRSCGELTDAECQQLKEGIELSPKDGWAAFQSVQRLGGEELPPVQKPGEEIRKFRYCAEVRIKCGKFHVVKRLFMSVNRSDGWAAFQSVQRCCSAWPSQPCGRSQA
ncbi:unnamed protein product [Effrenium voratum]|uniref:Pseudouridine synthase RsuA/RluA-like domain-containing protein n=1 Tax=Effrenium voratum TaxID=2562239 RepID=A0AA36NL16_9DINO|nr:unnamed protein product [Effrenium voratum]